VLISRYGSYHGNTIGALDAGGRPALRQPYEPWLGRFRHVSAAYAYRAGEPDAHALGDGQALAAELDAAIRDAGPGRVAAFLAEPVVGATLGAVVPPDDYWPAVAEVCARHGVLLIADEVMTGFGRTGRWFGVDHWGVRPDILVAAKGATSGYWPFGFAAASGRVYETVTAPGKGFVHGFTHSHSTLGATVAGETLRILQTERLVEASAEKGVRLMTLLKGALEEHPAVGEIRGRGLMVGIEFVADRSTRLPFPRSAKVAETVLGAARERGVLVYMGTGNADGVDGDSILLGPPFVITDEEMQRVAEVLAEAVDVATTSVPA
jgi:adenosylmethionine-8-amino-7-oxononanoate aminotransferase